MARFSGVSTGACIGHISPEALAGGPIGKVRESDQIEIVIDRNRQIGTVHLVGEGDEHFGAEEGDEAASRAQPPARSCAASRPARGYAALGGAGAGERRCVGRVRVRCGSDYFAIGEERVKLYRTGNGNFVEDGGKFFRVPESNWDALIAHDDLSEYLRIRRERRKAGGRFRPRAN